MDGHPQVMRRKAGLGRRPPEIGRPTPARALRAALARAAQDVAGIIAVASEVEFGQGGLSGLVEQIPENALMAMTEGPDSRFGLVVVDPACLAAIIEALTIGHVSRDPAAPRAPTGTDASLAADFIDRALEMFEVEALTAGLDIAPVVRGFRFAQPLGDTRAVTMTLDDVLYTTARVTLDLGEGAKQGRIDLFFAHTARLPAMPGPSADWPQALADAVGDSRVTLGAILGRNAVSLADLSELQVGSVVPLPGETLAAIEVVGLDGRAIATGRLGQINGNRAVRICLPACEGLNGGGALPSPLQLPSGPHDALAAIDPADQKAGDNSTGRTPEIPGETAQPDLSTPSPQAVSEQADLPAPVAPLQV